MNMKTYIIILCLTYCIQTVNCIDETEIRDLWDVLKGSWNYIFEREFLAIYEDEDREELIGIFRFYGNNMYTDHYGHNDFRMRFEEFTSAAHNGHIQRWPKKVIQNIFNTIILNGEDRSYVTCDEINSHYRLWLSPGHQIGNFYDNNILSFDAFRRAINIGILPKPVCDPNASLVAIHTVFQNIISPESSSNVCITNKYLIEYYTPELENIMTEFGRDNGSMLYYDDFIRAVDSGRLPVPLCGDDASEDELRTIFHELCLERDCILNGIPFRRLINYYELQFEEIVEEFGEVSYQNHDEKVLYFHNFRKAVISGKLPLQLRSKNAIHQRSI